MPSPPTRRLAFAQSFSLVFLSAGFGLCGLEFLCALCLSAVCIIDTSVDQLCGSLRESEKCVRAPRNVTQVLPYGRSRVPRNLR